MDSAVDAIVTFDENGRIDSCSLAAERLFGYAASGLVERCPAAPCPPVPARSAPR